MEEKHNSARSYGHVVSVLAYFSADTSLNPAEVYYFCLINNVWIERKSQLKT